MAVPKRRTSKSKQGMRRSHHNLGIGKAVQYCVNCGEPVMAHRACSACGFYRSRFPLKVKTEDGQE